MSPSIRNTNVLVTGAFGFIGTHLVRKLASLGCNVVAIGHGKPSDDNEITKKIKLIDGDINDFGIVERQVDKIDALVHLAAFIPSNQEDSSCAEECLKTNAITTLRLAEMCVNRKKKVRFIYLSAAQTYAQSRIPVEENGAQFPVFRAPYYLTSKLAGEIFTENLRLSKGLPAFILKVGSCYGPRISKRNVAARFMGQASQGLPLKVTAPNTKCDFVYVSNVVDAIVKSLTSTKFGIYNIGSGKLHSILELAQMVAKTYPERKVKIVVVDQHQKKDQSFSPFIMRKARKYLDYNPIKLQEGLRRYRKEMERSAP